MDSRYGAHVEFEVDYEPEPSLLRSFLDVVATRMSIVRKKIEVDACCALHEFGCKTPTHPHRARRIVKR